jgi:drug/metabolite transporter (DMT)-like permease
VTWQVLNPLVWPKPDVSREHLGADATAIMGLDGAGPYKSTTGFWIAATAAMLFSAKAILAKLMYRHNVDATTVISLRLAMAGPVFLVIAWFESIKAKATKTPLTGKEIALIWLLGLLGYYLSSLLDFMGLQYIPAALERLILFLTPTIVAFISWIFLRQSIDVNQRSGLFIGYSGMVLVFWDQLSHASVSGAALLLGSILCFAAAISYAVYLVLSGSVVKKIGSLRLVAYAMSVSSLLTALHFLAFAKQDLRGLSWPVYGYSALNAVFCTIVPVYLTMLAIDKIGAARTSQLSMLGPVSLIFLGYWILGEAITLIQLLGTAVVLVGIGLVTRTRQQK